MALTLLMFTLAVLGASTLTYVYDPDGQFWWRLASGVSLGTAILGLAGFVLSSLLGMNSIALVIASLVAGSPLLLLVWSLDVRKRALADVRSALEDVPRAFREAGNSGLALIIFYVLATTVFWYLCARVMYENVGGIFTGLDTNIGDLPFHLGVITSFSLGENFPPQHPEFADVRLTYPFVTDFVTAMFVRAGASLAQAFFLQNLVLLLALVALLHRWSLRLTGDRSTALLTPVIVLLSGGFGWWSFLKEAAQNGGIFTWLGKLSHDYTIMAGGYRWGNSLTSLFLTQRGILLGVTLAIIVFNLWLQAAANIPPTGDADDAQAEDGKIQDEIKSSYSFLNSPFARRQMVAAGLITGLLPLVHAHSFVVTVGMAACLAMVQGGHVLVSSRRLSSQPGTASELVALRSVLTPWSIFLGIAIAVGAPQALWALRGTAMQAGNFIGWQTGWDHGTENIIWFWIKNTAFFFPLLITAFAWLWREIKGRLLFFLLPFALCFIVPNLVRLAPWVWDNNKVLFYWWIAFAPLLALVLVRLWQASAGWRFLAVFLLIAQTGAGSLDVWRAASGEVERQVYNAQEIAFADLIKRQAPPQAVILHAPTYNDPVYLTGRRSFMGYPGHLWSHGIAFSGRETDLKAIFSGQNDAAALIEKNGIQFMVIGPLEAAAMRERGAQLNRTFFERYQKVGAEGDYQLFKATATQK